jgi:hypothetical protein
MTMTARDKVKSYRETIKANMNTLKENKKERNRLEKLRLVLPIYQVEDVVNALDRLNKADDKLYSHNHKLQWKIEELNIFGKELTKKDRLNYPHTVRKYLCSVKKEIY